jgi:hypothetical protein|tara:strand:+ start:2382 stop:2579 length:198 start_codon:yes stop_codon:yes gene_type:complete
MNTNKIRKKGKKIISFENRTKSHESGFKQKKFTKREELLGLYYIPDPNSPINKLIRFMGKKAKGE